MMVSIIDQASSVTLQQWKDVAEIARNFGFLLAIIGGALGLWLAWRRTEAAKTSAQAALNTSRAALQQAEAGLKQIENMHRSLENTSENNALVQKSHSIDRFSKAIEQMGDENLTVRLGGIYTLSMISENFDGFYRSATDIFRAYIYENTDIPKVEISEEDYKKYKDDIQKIQLEEWMLHKNPARMDIQAVLKAYIESREKKRVGPLYIKSRDLSGLELIGLDLSGASLNMCHLKGVSALGANFSDAILFGVNFTGSNIQKAKFDRSYLNFSNFTGANLSDSVFSGASLECVTFTNTRLEGADLSGAIGLTQAQLELAFIDETTKLPKELGSGPIKEVPN
jgi:hypothetical protein